MIQEAHYRAVLNFYYLLLQNDELTLSIAHRALTTFQKQVKRYPEKRTDLIFIKILNMFFEKYRDSRIPVTGKSQKGDWHPRNSQSLLAWKSFVRSVSAEYAAVIIFHYVLGYSIATIAEALDLPSGTVEFRLSRGIEAMTKNNAIQSVAKA
jgi:DNA-directed RNA polymerase specialized sigma24 family protein